MPVTKSSHFTIKNKMGITVVDVAYTLVWNANGSMNGAGHYIANLRTVLGNMDVLWGYKVDLVSVATDAINYGSVADPIPALGVDLKFRVHTYLKDGQFTDSYSVTGNGKISKTIK